MAGYASGVNLGNVWGGGHLEQVQSVAAITETLTFLVFTDPRMQSSTRLEGCHPFSLYKVGKVEEGEEGFHKLHKAHTAPCRSIFWFRSSLSFEPDTHDWACLYAIITTISYASI